MCTSSSPVSPAKVSVERLAIEIVSVAGVENAPPPVTVPVSVIGVPNSFRAALEHTHVRPVTAVELTTNESVVAPLVLATFTGTAYIPVIVPVHPRGT
jgi:hypothetical protein